MTQAEYLRQHYTALLSEFQIAFPHVQPPAPSWWGLWLQKYDPSAIHDAIQTLQNHRPEVKARFTQDSTGKAISALLREDALRRAITGAPKSGRP
jgi:hypothetical protein